MSASATEARRCFCGAPARRALASEHEARALARGARTKYACATCQRTFSIESAKTLIPMAVGAVVLTAIGVVLFGSAPGWGWPAWSCSGLVTLSGVIAGIGVVRGLAHRFRHPLA